MIFMDGIVYDIEIVNLVKPEPGYTSCGGWDDHKGMGIAVIGWYDYRYMCYGHTLGDLASLAKFQVDADGRQLIGFNIHGFDNKVLRANGVQVDDNATYDILQEIWWGLGIHGPYNFRTHGGYSLDAVYKATMGKEFGKSGSGADAPKMWQDGKHQEVIDYCINDVRLTKELVDFILENGYVVNPKNGERIVVAKPDHAPPHL